MNRFLKHNFGRFGRCLAPELNASGQIVRNYKGEPNYIKVSQKTAIATACLLCGSTNPYDNPWNYHADPKVPTDDFLVCLEPTEENRELAREVDNANRKVADALEAETQCPYLGTVRCKFQRRCELCKDCEHLDTKKCIRCKRKCEQCPNADFTRTISRDNVFNEDGNGETVSHFDPPADTDIAGEYAEREVLGALYEKLTAVDLLDDKQRMVLQLTYERKLSEREIADMLGYKSKTQVVRIREKALSILRESLKSFRG